MGGGGARPRRPGAAKRRRPPSFSRFLFNRRRSVKRVFFPLSLKNVRYVSVTRIRLGRGVLVDGERRNRSLSHCESPRACSGSAEALESGTRRLLNFEKRKQQLRTTPTTTMPTNPRNTRSSSLARRSSGSSSLRDDDDDNDDDGRLSELYPRYARLLKERETRESSFVGFNSTLQKTTKKKKHSNLSFGSGRPSDPGTGATNRSTTSGGRKRARRSTFGGNNNTGGEDNSGGAAAAAAAGGAGRRSSRFAPPPPPPQQPLALPRPPASFSLKEATTTPDSLCCNSS